MSPKNKYVYICVEYIYIYFAKIHKQPTLSSDTTKMFVLIDNVLAYLLEQDDQFVSARFAIQGQIVTRRLTKTHISKINDALLLQFISYTNPHNETTVSKKLLDSMRTAVRQLLEATACVSRECILVQRNQNIRRARKRLLSDWYRLGADPNIDALLLVVNSAWRFLDFWRPFVTSMQQATQDLFTKIAHYLIYGNVDLQRITALIQAIMGDDHSPSLTMDDALQEVPKIQQCLHKMLPPQTHPSKKPLPFDSANLLLNFRDWTTDNGLLQELLLCYRKHNDKHERHSVARLIQLWLESYWHDDHHTLNDILHFWYNNLAPSNEYRDLFTAIVQLLTNKTRIKQLKVQYIGRPDQVPEDKNLPSTDYQTIFRKFKIEKIDVNDELSHTANLNDMLLRWTQGDTLDVDAFALDVSPWSLAKTLTLLESALYLDIETIDFTKYFKHTDTPIGSVFTFSNQLSSYVLETTIQQTRTIQYWLKVALSCLYLRNLNSLTSIITSLQNHSIERMSLPVNERSEALFERLKVIVHPNNNYNIYRTIIQQIADTDLPCVPFTPLFIRDITFIRDGNDTFTKDGTSVNMQKFHQITKIIAFAQFLQQKQYEKLQCSDITARSLLGSMAEVHSLYNNDKDRAYQVSIAKVPRLP